MLCIKKTSFSFLVLLQIPPRPQLLPLPEKQAAGPSHHSQLSTCPQWLQGLFLTPRCLRAPHRHPLPTPLCPVVTQAQEGVSKVAVTALSGCWRPPLEHLMTIMMQMGLAGFEQWRTSTLSTKHPTGCFSFKASHWMTCSSHGMLCSPIWFVYLLVFMSRHFLFL